MLLAIDTATRMLSLALHNGDRIVAELSWNTVNYHTVELTPTLASMLKRSQISPADLSAIAVAIGPGSFTGLRIGLAVAKGLALAHGMPLIGVPTLDVVAASIGPEDVGLVAVLQAGRKRICAARYQWIDGEWRQVGEIKNTTWKMLLADQEEPALFVGEIDEQGARLLRRRRSKAYQLSPAAGLRRAGFLAEIGWEQLKRNRVDDPAGLAPIYLSMPGSSDS